MHNMIFTNIITILDQHPLLVLEQHLYQPILPSLTLKTEGNDWLRVQQQQQQQQWMDPET